MGRSLVVAVLALVGLLCAAGMGYAAYVVSRGSVAVPVTRLQQAPQTLTPKQVRSKAAKAKAKKRVRTTTTTTRPVAPPPPPTTTVDDHGGGGHGGGGGSGGGGGGHGGDD
jgi:flagellar basal body-associated protein FliL